MGVHNMGKAAILAQSGFQLLGIRADGNAVFLAQPGTFGITQIQFLYYAT